jgi:hypothetical protein
MPSAVILAGGESASMLPRMKLLEKAGFSLEKFIIHVGNLRVQYAAVLRGQYVKVARWKLV